MGTRQSTQDKVAELREVTREANAALKDLRRERREIDNLVKNAWDALIAEHAKRVEGIVHTSLGDFTDKLMAHNNSFQEAIMNRWGYIEAMCAADPKVARLIALHVLKDAGGTVETEKSLWHLVKEVREEDGTSTFAFPKVMGDRAHDDPRAEKAVQHAVSQHRPDIQLLPWPTGQQKGIDEE
jgi:hypothetical protein